jgi:hypothetical protein
MVAGAAFFSLALPARRWPQRAFREILINHKHFTAATWFGAAKFRGEGT